MKNNKLTYQKSGVNIKAADKFVNFISTISRKTKKMVNLRILGVLQLYPIYLKNIKIP